MRASVCLALIAIVFATGCPTRSRRTLVPAVPTTGDANARTRFEQARAIFERDGSVTPAEFEAIAREFPRDPVHDFALLYAGMAAVRSGEFPAAVEHLRRLDETPDVDPQVRARGQLFLGIALTYQQSFASAIVHLRAGEPVVGSADERVEWLASMAECLSRTGEVEVGLGHYDEWYRSATAAEKNYIVSRVQTLIDGLDAPEVERLYRANTGRATPTAAVVGAAFADELGARGDESQARDLRESIRGLRVRMGLDSEKAGTQATAVWSDRLGAVLPLTGRRQRLGEQVMRGLSVAVDVFDDATVQRKPLVIAFRDTTSNSATAAASADILAGQGCIALVGPIDGKSVDAVAERAVALGIPQLSLAPRTAERKGRAGGYVFHMMHSAEERAAVLARRALSLGVRDFAILAPDNGYGRAVGRAFRQVVEAEGGTVIVDTTYDASATSFGKVTESLRKPWQAIFVPDQAQRLELIAPALASANFFAAPHNSPPPKLGRKILLLSTAENLAVGFLRGSGRYTHGAILAPGFYPDRSDPVIGDFVDRYDAAYARMPTVWDAYAADAATLVSVAVDAGASSREDLATSLLRTEVTALTGDIRFGMGRRRSDAGLLYSVVRDREGAYAIRAQR